mmetsp:Transcript_8776/g.11895  ORF Transcript_8776/g.11895 Transcript_8776/m.11895 type:complete len:330 (+) Transcript_8776:60-1049(+)
MIFDSYIFIVRDLASIFRCYGQPGFEDVYSLLAQPEITCFDGWSYWKFTPFTAIGAIVYVFGYPAFLCYLFFHEFQTNADKQCRERWTLIIRRYNSSNFAWELVVILRKFMLAVAVSLAEKEIYKVQWTLSILNLFLLLQIWRQPFYFKKNNDVERDSLFILCLILIMSLSADSQKESATFGSIFNLLSFFGFMIYTAYTQRDDIRAHFLVIVKGKNLVDTKGERKREKAAQASKRLECYVNDGPVMVEFLARACETDIRTLIDTEKKIQSFGEDLTSMTLNERGLSMGGDAIKSRSIRLKSSLEHDEFFEDIQRQSSTFPSSPDMNTN